MALTPEMIQQLSEPIEEVYRACVDELLLNIASHLEGGNALSTLNWEVTKLAEMGQLRRENIKIIRSLTSNVSGILNRSLGSAITKALKEIEPELSAAVKANILFGTNSAPTASQSIINILTNYSEQATNKLNLVNTVMLNSSLSQYRKVIANTAIYEKQLEQAQKILNEQTGAVATGVSSRTQALRKAVKQMNAVGLTGFKDAAGRNWSAEAYVNMDIRTTVHNVAVQSVFARNADYGNSLISVSSHNGARPLCYPYQGKVYSTDGSSGQVEDLHGHTIDFVPLEDTSYGLPAGLLGINCGHMPSVFIPGMSVVRGEPQDKEANDRAYKLSQQQRRLEREVKNAKREAALLNAAGDKEGFEKAAAKIQQKQANLNKFTISTGRTMRLDRLQVSGYDRSVAGKVTAINKSTSNTIADNPFTAERKQNALRFTDPKAADLFVRSKSGEVWRAASEKEKDAIYDYSTSSGRFNRPLAGYLTPPGVNEPKYGWLKKNYVGPDNMWIGYEGVEENIRLATDLVGRSSYPFDMWLRRATQDNALESFLGIDEDSLASLSNAQLKSFIGTENRMHNFISTSTATAKGTGFTGSVYMDIYAPTGTRMMYLEPFAHYGKGAKRLWDGIADQTDIGYEAEMLIQRGAYYRITDIYRSDNDGKVYVTLDVVPSEGYDLIQQTTDWKGERVTKSELAAQKAPTNITPTASNTKAVVQNSDGTLIIFDDEDDY